MNAECPDENAVLAFLAGSLPPGTRDLMEAHLANCSACMDLTTWAAVDAANLSRGPDQERRPFIGQLGPGARVGRYQVLAPVGRGGMGEVYAAYHPDLDRRIALKVVYETDTASAERRARLLREARAIARLSHPNVVAVHDAGTVGDRVFIAMEFVDGETIDVWLRGERRSWRQILDVFLAAGRGLAAAHAAGIIHRDFKPQNVMVGKDGSVRVMDFGLARLDAEPRETEPTDGDSPSDGDELPHSTKEVTRTGALLGTPAYMAPEQFRREPIDARADQFGFCVAFYEALHGSRPDVSPVSSRAAPLAPGDRSFQPRLSGAPQWLRKAIARGLAHRPDDRYPSMAQLLRDLARGRARLRRHSSIAASAFLLVAVVLGGWRLSHARRFDCRPPRDRIADAWPAGEEGRPRREAVRAAFLAARRSDGVDIWHRFASALDRHMGQWSTMYAEACEATHGRGEQSEEVLDLRMRCLNENLDQVRALTEVLTSADASAATNAVAAVSQLTPISRCADIPLLRSAVALPRDERTLLTVQRLRQRLAKAHALVDVGRVGDAMASVTELRNEVEAVGYKPLLANLLDLSGKVLIDQGLPREAEEALHEGLSVAEEAADDVAAATIASNLSYVVGYLAGRHEEGLQWLRLGDAILVRAKGDRDLLRSWNLSNAGAIYYEMGDLAEARRRLEQSVAIKERIFGGDHYQVGFGLSMLGVVLGEQGEVSAALAKHDRAIAILEATVDPNSVRLAPALLNKAEILIATGRLAEAAPLLRRALAIWDTNGGGRIFASYVLAALGSAALAQHDPIRAVEWFERALRIRAREMPDSARLAETQFALATALWDTGGDRSRALSLARSARTTYLARKRERQAREIDAWLSRHRARHG